MSKYSYAGDFRNPTEGWNVIANPNGEGFIIGVPITDEEIVNLLRSEQLQEAQELLALKDSTGGYRPHTSQRVFEEEDEAYEYIQSLEESYEEDYDDYLEENRHSIVQMERYEMWRNEY